MIKWQSHCLSCFFFFNDTATTEIYTLSLHDALPISRRAFLDRGLSSHRQGRRRSVRAVVPAPHRPAPGRALAAAQDRKSTRLNSSHLVISYAVFCLKKKKLHRPRPTVDVSTATHLSL